jgi:hypothetical protein
MAFRLRDRLGGLDEHDVGGALQGLEFCWVSRFVIIPLIMSWGAGCAPTAAWGGAPFAANFGN